MAIFLGGAIFILRTHVPGEEGGVGPGAAVGGAPRHCFAPHVADPPPPPPDACTAAVSVPNCERRPTAPQVCLWFDSADYSAIHTGSQKLLVLCFNLILTLPLQLLLHFVFARTNSSWAIPGMKDMPIPEAPGWYQELVCLCPLPPSPRRTATRPATRAPFDHWEGGGGTPNSKRPPQPPAQPQHANHWAPLTHKRHPPHPAQPRHANDGAPRTRKRQRQEHRPQRDKTQRPNAARGGENG